MNSNRMANAYGSPMATPMQRYGTVRNGTVRHQDPGENSRLSDTRTPVDNPKWDRFIELDNAGWSAPQIAKTLGVSARTVTRWRKTAGRSQPGAATPRPAEVREAALRLVEDGASFAEVAATVGVSPKTINRWFPDHQAWSRNEAGRWAATVRQFNKRNNERKSA